MSRCWEDGKTFNDYENEIEEMERQLILSGELEPEDSFYWNREVLTYGKYL